MREVGLAIIVTDDLTVENREMNRKRTPAADRQRPDIVTT
jgi:hypothetical protein